MNGACDCKYFDAPSVAQLHAPEAIEEPLWQLTEEMRDYAIVVLDPQGIVASWHEGARGITGHEAREIIGTDFSRFYPPEAIEGHRPELELEIAEVEGRFQGQGVRVRQDGSQFWAHVELRALRDRDGGLRGFGQVMRVDSPVGHAPPLRGADNRMHELIAVLSHELRNPLAPIRNAVELMRRRPMNQAELQSWLAMLDRNSAQLVRLVDDLLDVRLLRLGALRDGSYPQQGMGDAPSQTTLDSHFVKPLYWAALRQLLSAFQPPTGHAAG